jgi:CheY-like chemotaxis protein
MGKKILAVDNHPVMLKFLSVLLSGQGHTVLTAEDSLSALRVLEDFTPDVMFIDLVMPKINGKRLCRMVRGNERFKDTYVVILSAIAAEQEVDFVSFGADACVAKGSFDAMGKHLLRTVELSDLKPRGM